MSCKLFNIKIKNELRQLGYTDYLIDLIGDIEFDDNPIKEKLYEKYYRTYQKKYEGEKLESIIKQKMYQQGFYE